MSIVQDWINVNLGIRLNKIRTCSTNFYRNCNFAPNMPFYDDHGPTHWNAVENKIHLLIPGDYYIKLTELERYYLLASAWLHDIGMLPSIAQRVDQIKYFKNANPDYYKIRDDHHIISALFIINHYRECSLDQDDAYILSKIVWYHRKKENIDEVDEKIYTSNGDQIRIQLLAAYLRLADALHSGGLRTSEKNYAVCLSYNLPIDDKIHWIKGQIIQSIIPDPINHTIETTFKAPMKNQLEEMNLSLDQTNYNNLTELVKNELEEELLSVLLVLANGGITFYSKIKKNIISFTINERLLKDLIELIDNFYLIMVPSASKLLEIVLQTSSRILGITLNINEVPMINDIDKNNVEIKKKDLMAFIQSLEENILSTRTCHLGLRRLIEICKHYAEEYLKPQRFEEFVNILNNYFKTYNFSKNKIRENSKKVFKELYQSHRANNNNELKYFNILLYGYSELVVEALCAFQEYLVSIGKNSDVLRLFICEGQPKTKTGTYDRLIYHDGVEYALSLRKHNFNNLNIIPDITFRNIIENEKINLNLIMVGANGFTENYFRHSAGHSSIIKSLENQSWPKTVLVVSSLKFFQDDRCDIHNDSYSDKNIKIGIDGCVFWSGNTRQDIWFTKDKETIRKLKDSKIKLLNPREDIIPIKLLDYIISDIEMFDSKNEFNFKIKSETEVQTDENMKKFIEKTNEFIISHKIDINW